LGIKAKTKIVTPHFFTEKQPHRMEKLLDLSKWLLALLLLVYLSNTNLQAQDCWLQGGNFEDYPRGREELDYCLHEVLGATIKEPLLQQLFDEAEVVVEAYISNAWSDKKQEYVFYEMQPYTIFKGSLSKRQSITITTLIPQKTSRKFIENGREVTITQGDDKDNLSPGGEWSLGKRQVGLYFLKKDTTAKNAYRFLNPKKSWFTYSYTDGIINEHVLREVLYSRITTLEKTKCQKTDFFRKKKENFENAKKGSRFPTTIDSLSHDTVPAGILSGNASKLTIYGSGFDSTTQVVLMRNANSNQLTENFVALHPRKHVVHWASDSIEIIIPSMGYNSNDSLLGDTRNAGAGSGKVMIYEDGFGIIATSPQPVIVPYSIINDAKNSDNEVNYYPYEPKMYKQNGYGGLTFVYEPTKSG